MSAFLVVTAEEGGAAVEHPLTLVQVLAALRAQPRNVIERAADWMCTALVGEVHDWPCGTIVRIAGEVP